MANHCDTPEDLYVRTQHDEREYLSVLEIFYYDENGEEVIHEAATKSCFALVTCGDMSERYQVLQQQVEANLKAAGIKYLSVTMEDGY